MTSYEISDDCGSTISVECDDMDEALARASAWVRGGDWGGDGARVEVHIAELDADGEEVDDDFFDVDVAPDHSSLIVDACGGRATAEYERCCGPDPEDHEWTAEDSWLTGGTSMRHCSHCQDCGLSRVEHVTGAQRNPGDHDTTEYSWRETGDTT